MYFEVPVISSNSDVFEVNGIECMVENADATNNINTVEIILSDNNVVFFSV